LIGLKHDKRTLCGSLTKVDFIFAGTPRAMRGQTLPPDFVARAELVHPRLLALLPRPRVSGGAQKNWLL